MKTDAGITTSVKGVVSVEPVTLTGDIQVPCGKLGLMLVRRAGRQEYELDAE